MLIRGDKLNPTQRAEVLAAFVHRWTHENARQTYGGRCPACVQQEQSKGASTVNGKPWHEYHNSLTTDAEWLTQHAFHFLKDGSRLMATRNYAEPAYLAEREATP